MSRYSDYLGGMSNTRFRDDEIESLLTRESTGSEELEGLEEFIAAFATQATQPRDTYHMGTTLAAISRATAPTARRGLRRLATLAATGAIFVALSGVALAADGAAPGDPLYRLDRALEAIGIGDGGFDERVGEFNVMLDRGEEEEAYEFMAEVIAEAGTSEAAQQPNVGPANDLPAPATGNRSDGEAAGESRSGNNRSEAPGQDDSQNPGNGNAPFNRSDETPPAHPNNQGRAVGPDGETPNPGQDNPGQGNTNPASGNPGQGNQDPGQDNSGQGNINSGQDNPGQGTDTPASGTPGQDNPEQGNPNPGAGQGQPPSNPPDNAGQGTTGQGSPDQSNANFGGSQGQGRPASTLPANAGQGNTGQGGPTQNSGQSVNPGK